MRIQRFAVCLAISTMLGAFGIFNTFGQTSAFSYQGKLTDAGAPANGTYIMQFSLWDAASGGTSLGTLSDLNVIVRDGMFNVQLDFGAPAVSGNDLYLEFAVKKLPGDTYTTLSPRQQILSAPHAIKSGTAGSSDDSAKLGGVDAARFVQSDANGNVSLIGNLTVTGSTTFDTVNAATQFNLAGVRAMTADGSGNLAVGTAQGTPPTPFAKYPFHLDRAESSTGIFNTFLGNWAGLNNSTGSSNTFTGYAAGYLNTTGERNAFFGAAAGISNISGYANTFLGHRAGYLNGDGIFNVYIGEEAGLANVSGSRNVVIGGAAGSLSPSGSNNSVLGTDAGQNNTGDDNSFFGSEAGRDNTTGTSNAFFGRLSGRFNTAGKFNSFYGASSGAANTIGDENSFFGMRSGEANIGGSQNAFFGVIAGRGNTTGGSNTFVGRAAGGNNTTGSNNTSVGANSAAVCCGFILTGSNNSFFGNASGGQITTGAGNSFFGSLSGYGPKTVQNTTLIGSGANASVDGITNATAIGANAVVSQSNSLVLGNNANVGIGISAPSAKLEVVGDAKVSGAGNGVIFPDGTKQTTAATAPGTVVTSINGLNNAVTLAAGPNVTITPAGNTLTIAAASSPAGILNQTSQQIGANFNIDGTGTANKFDATQYNSYGIRVLAAPPESFNLLVGFSAGSNLRFGVKNTLVGFESGLNTTDGNDNAFFGTFAGRQITTGSGNTILGAFAGQSVTTGGDNTLVGDNAGDGLLTGTNNTALGRNAWLGPNVSFATAIGAGSLATTDNTIVIGRSTDTVTIPGTLTKAAGSFRIDHPLDPYNKYLFHSFVESPDMMNVYNGNITTDANGEATVLLPGYFEALNKDVRYQLTVIGIFAQAIISEEVSGNKFKIKTDKPNVKVSWQVTGIRKDPYAEKNRIVPEVEKPASEKGKLQNPDVYGEKP